MTAELSVSNKQAVALAADSAVTFGEGDKVFTSAHKIFCLSEEHPVGIMIYGNADFIGVPWETVVTAYRDKLGRKKMDTIQDYATDFCKFLRSSENLFPKEIQVGYAQLNMSNFLEILIQSIEKKAWQKVKSERESIPAEIVEKSAEEVISEMHGHRLKADFVEGVDAKQFDDFLSKNNDFADQQISYHFEKIPTSSAIKIKIKEILASLPLKKGYKGGQTSGVVIAGFGSKEIFPSIANLSIYAMLENHLNYKEEMQVISHTNGANVRAYAQQDMARSFIEGIHPDLLKKVVNEIGAILREFPTNVIDDIAGIASEKKEEIKAALTKKASQIHDGYIKNLTEFKREEFIDKIVNMVALLPKGELATFAETLVNLTSFKRRFSMSAETVGGPVDVVVISKHDGFVWVKRKSYFESELNHKKV
jgi:DNA-directed RNA polymerase subunit F